MAPEITVITAVRNGSNYLSETIESVQKQTFQDWEYIIIDDASQDNTSEIINLYAESDSRIIPIFRKNKGGPFAAANHGIKLAKGKFIIRTDADDISFPERFERQLNYLESNPEIQACASFGQLIDENSKPTGYKFRYPTSPNVIKWL